ncbi:hypothetical protein, partial [uncultured Alistipes sp.]|uniref:hypothetical protein n=1 Tax=uncultured Alistipes sp. TaxID=538949 RepID=UPI0026E59008
MVLKFCLYLLKIYVFTSTKIIIVCRITTFSDRIFYPLTAYDGQKRDSPHDEAAQPVALGRS